MCFYQEGKFDYDMLISESENIFISFPLNTSPLHPLDKEPISHFILAPKSHFSSFLEIEEEVQAELKNYKQSFVEYFKNKLDMQVVFIETSIQSDKNIPHAYLDVIGIPNDL